MTPESHLEREILRTLCRGPVRLFRNTVAVGWVGSLIGHENGHVILRNARRNSFGLVKGSGDLIGYRTVTVTPDMVGQRIAVFTSLELKAPKGTTRPEQIQWDSAVRAAGGYSGIVRSVGEAEGVLGFPPQ